jgi:hypothetical protein
MIRSAETFVNDLANANPESGSKSWHLHRQAREILEEFPLLWEEPTRNLWESFENREKACIWLIEYDARWTNLQEKVSELPTETLQGSLENLESILEALPKYEDHQERQMLLLYANTIREELEDRKKAEADPEYRQEREEMLEAQARRKKAKQDAREYLEKTKPRAS